ncbi:MAG: 4-hydroxythreonine-4-phosphate dehydrogenase PdxA [Candidatus Omnitrophica bacterium]|nr:4-hydroxythreonine-4-phosphate dehydrogenase PdxA [Candidatus Omnitrophota bacterium]
MIRTIITIGDPSGIGPEITIKAIGKLLKKGFDFVPIIVGDIAIITKTISNIKMKMDLSPFDDTQEKGKIKVYNVEIIKNKKFPQGKDNPLAGKASFSYLCEAWRLLCQGKGDCLITAPISKKAWSMAGIPYSGHTEALSSFSQEKTYMLMSAEKLNILLFTTHIPMKEIWQYLTKKNLFLSSITTAEFLARFYGKKDLKIAFCGLNPHAGESGLLGTEEKKIIEPVIAKIEKSGFNASGPYPADSVFRQVFSQNNFYLLISLYHDQLLPTLKTLFFEKLVNITVNKSGWIRTSPGHGTAFDIAGKNIADACPMENAIIKAVEMANRKKWIHF